MTPSKQTSGTWTKGSLRNGKESIARMLSRSVKLSLAALTSAAILPRSSTLVWVSVAGQGGSSLG